MIRPTAYAYHLEKLPLMLPIYEELPPHDVTFHFGTRISPNVRKFLRNNGDGIETVTISHEYDEEESTGGIMNWTSLWSALGALENLQ